jgi:hypothetical protein
MQFQTEATIFSKKGTAVALHKSRGSNHTEHELPLEPNGGLIQDSPRKEKADEIALLTQNKCSSRSTQF